MTVEGDAAETLACEIMQAACREAGFDADVDRAARTVTVTSDASPRDVWQAERLALAALGVEMEPFDRWVERQWAITDAAMTWRRCWLVEHGAVR